jgi:hypothetical protein
MYVGMEMGQVSHVKGWGECYAKYGVAYGYAVTVAVGSMPGGCSRAVVYAYEGCSVRKSPRRLRPTA